jgi:hypothetical protein
MHCDIQRLCDADVLIAGLAEFWAPFLSTNVLDSTLAGSGDMSPRSRAMVASKPAARWSRPSTANSDGRISSMQVIPPLIGSTFSLSGNPFPPPNFLKDKRDILQEQQRVIRTLKAADEALGSQPDVSGVKYVRSGSLSRDDGGRALPVVVKRRPMTARAAMQSTG